MKRLTVDKRTLDLTEKTAKMAQQVSGQKQQGKMAPCSLNGKVKGLTINRAANAVFQFQGHPSEHRLPNRQC
jgi:hypothetical protein